jgi:hypothetical protein
MARDRTCDDSHAATRVSVRLAPVVQEVKR